MLQLLMVLVVAISLGVMGGRSTGFAQVDATTPSAQPQTPAVISQLQPITPPASGISAKLITPSTTNRLAPNSESRNSTSVASPTRGGAARGTRNSPAQFMKPPTIGPLFCDPLVDISC